MRKASGEPFHHHNETKSLDSFSHSIVLYSIPYNTFLPSTLDSFLSYFSLCFLCPLSRSRRPCIDAKLMTGQF